MSSSKDSQARRETSSSSINTSSTRHLASIVVEAAASSRKINRAASNLAQLRITKTNLYGREDEIKLLRGKLRELATKRSWEGDEQQKSATNMILVAGECGTGKSALILRGLGDAASRYGYAFAKGKFDQKLQHPLSAFSDAMTNLCRHIQKCDCAALVREEIQNEFDGERREQLRSILPGCAELFGPLINRRRSSASTTLPLAQIGRDDVSCSTANSSRRNHASVIGKEAVSRTHYAVRRLLKIICSHLKGVILFIDDLQWSDKATLDMLNNIVLDKEIMSLLIVGAYREDEVNDHLASYINDLQLTDVPLTQINVGNLSAENVTSFVAEALGTDDDDSKVETLAKSIHRKTEGNPFFVSMFLTSLYDDKILQYNYGAMRWIWDDAAVESRAVTENVASVLVNKINRMKEETQLVLMAAACLGAHFQVSTVIKIMENLSDGELRSSLRSSSSSLHSTELDKKNVFDFEDACSSSIASFVEEAEEDGLIEIDDNKNCYFVHDQIQAAAFDLILPDQRDSFRRKIGCILLKSLPPEELETNFFEVVGLLNYAATHLTDEESAQLAELNMKAGTKASENGAFDTAKKYYEAGRKALGKRGWERHFGLMVDLCSDGANACYLTGGFVAMNELIDEVLSKSVDAIEKYRVTEVKVKSLYAQVKVNEAIHVALGFRRQLGLPTLKRKRVSKLTIVREYLRVMRLLKKVTVEDIINLPELDDERYELGQRMNELLGPSLYLVEPTMSPLNIFVMVTTTLKHGLNPTSCYALVTLGRLLCGYFDKPHQGREMARAAELMLKQPEMRRITSNTIFCVQTFCYHWTSPLQDTIAPLLKGYEEGLAIGDTQCACFCLLSRCFNLFFIGRSLDSVQEELEASIDVTTQLKQYEPRSLIELLHIAVKKLRGVNTTDDGIKMDDIVQVATATGDSNKAAIARTFKLEVFVILQQWDEALELVRKANDVRLAANGAFVSVRFTFLEALTYLKAAQSTTGLLRMKMKRCGKKPMELIQGWAKRGNVNVVHYLHILQAELAILVGKTKKAENSFKTAILSSKRNGFLHDTALVHELASTFYEAQEDEYWSNYQIECAKKSYKEWGCRRKVDQIEGTNEKLFKLNEKIF